MWPNLKIIINIIINIIIVIINIIFDILNINNSIILSSASTSPP